MKPLLTVALTISLVTSSGAFEIEKGATETTVNVAGLVRIVTINGQQYTITDMPTDAGLVEITSEPSPKRAKGFKGVDAGVAITEDEVLAVIEADFKHSAYDFESVKLRNVQITGPSYVYWCSSYFAGCWQHEYRAGVVVRFESTGRNLHGGMTGYRQQALIIRKVPPKP